MAREPMGERDIVFSSPSSKGILQFKILLRTDSPFIPPVATPCSKDKKKKKKKEKKHGNRRLLQLLTVTPRSSPSLHLRRHHASPPPTRLRLCLSTAHAAPSLSSLPLPRCTLHSGRGHLLRSATFASPGGGGGFINGNGNSGGGGGGDDGGADGTGGRNGKEVLMVLAEAGRQLESARKDLAAAIEAGRIPGSVVSRSPFFRWLMQLGGLKERLLADGLFPAKIAVEGGVAIFTEDDASGSPSRTENSLIDSASGTVAKPSTQAAEEEAPAQAEAAEQFEQQGEISGGKHVHSESQQNLDDQNDSRYQTNERKLRFNAIPSSGESDSAQGAIQNQMMEKIELTWKSKGKDNLPNENGDLGAAGRTSEQIILKWKSEPQTVLIIQKPGSEDALDLCETIVRWLNFDNKRIYVEPRVKQKLIEKSCSFNVVKSWQDDEPGQTPDLRGKHEREKKDMLKEIDLVITLGGDGTVLWAASLFQGPVPPVVSFSLGSLGFMTPFSRENYEKTLKLILKDPFPITLRRRLQCHVVRHLADKGKAEEDENILVLNEVTIDRGQGGYLTKLQCECDGSEITTVQGDGLILSTTSGSTAYSLAAGGSMVHPQVPGILFTPICPHSLSFRPLILPDHVTIQVEVPLGSRGSAWVSFDGQKREELKAEDKLICSMAQWPVLTACPDGSTSTRDFLIGIREGLHWNLRKPQLPDGPQKQEMKEGDKVEMPIEGKKTD
ncbi:NAD(H) kinase 1 [Eucalyptus grandis]|uniref:NAD(H) kinase 1 n=1 Tax=Eucalyptus grandis TaxID=71139 RepID=UPI00192EF49A|nr:NAD(H) kinase 1 [Eucalyptus grandis]